jgi:outer membrane protein TolC
MIKKISHFLIVSVLLTSVIEVSAQTNDSLSLNAVLTQVLANFPTIKKNLIEAAAADAHIGMARTAYLPDVSINSSYAHIGPVSSIEFPGLGVFKMFPSDNFSASVDVYETIYDFGRTKHNIDFAIESKKILSLSADQIKQRLSSGVITSFYAMVFLQEAVKIKDEQLKTLNEHLRFIEKKKETGSATQYEVLTTKVRISSIENQKTDLLSSLKVQICQLNSLLGQPEKTTLIVKKELQTIQEFNPSDSLLTFATQTRQELKIAQEKEAISELHYKVVGLQNNPNISFFANGGTKNGYFPDLNKQTPNYAVGIGLKIPLFDAGRKKFNLQLAQTDIDGNKEDIELARRTVVNEVVENEANVQSALQKISQSDLQLQQAQQAYTLAVTSFKSGVITNLELLDNSTSLSETKLQLLKTKIDYSLSVLKLKIALGEKVY